MIRRAMRSMLVGFVLALIGWSATVFVLAPTVALAQAVDPGPMPDVKAAAAEAILAVGAIATMFVVWGAKLLVSKLPPSVILFAVPVIGIALNYAAVWLGAVDTANPVLAALTATGATWLRELGTALPKGATPFTPTKGSF